MVMGVEWFALDLPYLIVFHADSQRFFHCWIMKILPWRSGRYFSIGNAGGRLLDGKAIKHHS